MAHNVLTILLKLDCFTLKNIGPSSANHSPSTAVTHCMYSYSGEEEEEPEEEEEVTNSKYTFCK